MLVSCEGVPVATGASSGVLMLLDDESAAVGLVIASGSIDAIDDDFVLPFGSTVGDTKGDRDGFKLGPSCKIARRKEALTKELEVSSLLNNFIAWFNSTTLCLFCSMKL